MWRGVGLKGKAREFIFNAILYSAFPSFLEVIRREFGLETRINNACTSRGVQSVLKLM